MQELRILNVLVITGPPRSGKSTLAHALHLLSDSQWDNSEALPDDEFCSGLYSLDRAYYAHLRSIESIGSKERINIARHFRELPKEGKVAFKRFVSKELERVRARTKFTLIIEGWQGGHLLERLQKLFEGDRFVHIHVERGSFNVEGRAFELPGFDAQAVTRDHSFSYYKEIVPRTLGVAAEVFQHLRRQSIARLVGETKYQRFEDLGMTQSGSDSQSKFDALELERLGLASAAGGAKRILDVGCQSGYFSIRLAKVSRAFRVTGLDANAKAARLAASYNGLVYELPNLSFFHGTALDYKRRQDVVLALSVFHYFRDEQQAFLDHLHGLIKPGGHLVLECGISEEQPEVPFVQKVQRGVDKEPCHFPNRKRLTEMLRGFDVLYEGASVRQKGDPIPRRVLHLVRV